MRNIKLVEFIGELSNIASQNQNLIIESVEQGHIPEKYQDQCPFDSGIILFVKDISKDAQPTWKESVPIIIPDVVTDSMERVSQIINQSSITQYDIKELNTLLHDNEGLDEDLELVMDFKRGILTFEEAEIKDDSTELEMYAQFNNNNVLNFFTYITSFATILADVKKANEQYKAVLDGRKGVKN